MRARHLLGVCPPMGFNPRPALRPGDATCDFARIRFGQLFQSAPGLEAGRCTADQRLREKKGVFQSAPGLEAGRCVYVAPKRRNGFRVSIRARP